MKKRTILALLLMTSLVSAGVLFNGNTDYISMSGTDLDDPTVFTIAFWIRWNSVAVSNQHLLNVDVGTNELRLRMGGAAAQDHCELWIRDGATDYVYASWNNDAFSADTWYFLAFTWAGGSAVPKMYYQAKGGAWTAATHDYTEGSGTVEPDENGGTWYLGNKDADDTQYHHGDIGFFGFWIVEMTEGQLKGLVNKPRNGGAYTTCDVLAFPGLHGASSIPNLCSANPTLTPANLSVGGGMPVGPIFGN
ncbi:MAG: LamG-like jellyroll fold domain-containing protein [Planctomycetota bacterium]|jgi:hypothetical protein